MHKKVNDKLVYKQTNQVFEFCQRTEMEMFLDRSKVKKSDSIL